ncbi:hypothetical protein LOD99_2432 [Oopsacas minuta]|uniref:Uncharacterized protein n=1 Tax=Oopsacas minuta TaxID=111878 RepID=A0AAV7K1R7_9METZ|nr:hypothetical protein LOD99_2432 [Oopsacas minuta]
MEIAVRKIFKLKSSRIISSTVKTLQLVIASIKPTWLIDSFKCSSEQLVRLLTELQLQSILCVLLVCDDLFIANRDGLISIIQARNISNVLVTDVSPKLVAPVVITETHKSYKLVIKHIEYINTQIMSYVSNSSVIDVFRLSNENDFPLEFTFVFGWLLGYPYLYFNSEHLDTQLNCLSKCPLKLFRVSSGGFVFLSFSIPLLVLEDYNKKVKDLLLQLYERILCSVKNDCQSIEIHESIQTLDLIAL